MLGNQVTGLIDFYFACNDLIAYDLAVTHVAWCFDKDDAFRADVSAALIEGYESVRPLLPAERAALPLLGQGAAMRFAMSRLAGQGRNIRLSKKDVEGNRNFATKLWNATRFAMMNGATVQGPLPAMESLSEIDKWVLSRLSETTAEYTDLVERYEFARACEVVYHFAWDDLCDWYLELSKEAFSSGNAQSTQRVLGHVLDQLFRLLHPVMPFLTEELWTIFTGGETLMKADWPVANASHLDKSSEELITQLQRVITEVRRFRNDQGVKPTQKIPGRFIAPADVAQYSSASMMVRTRRVMAAFAASSLANCNSRS